MFSISNQIYLGTASVASFAFNICTGECFEPAKWGVAASKVNKNDKSYVKKVSRPFEAIWRNRHYSKKLL